MRVVAEEPLAYATEAWAHRTLWHGPDISFSMAIQATKALFTSNNFNSAVSENLTCSQSITIKIFTKSQILNT